MGVIQESDQNENAMLETQPEQVIKTGVKKLAQSFERSSTGVSNSLTSVKRTMKNTASVERSESIQDKIRKFSLKDESVHLPVSKKLAFMTPTPKEISKLDFYNNNNHKEEKFVPMAERIQDYESELDDELVLSNLQDVVRSRRELFASPNSTLQRPPKPQPKKQQLANGSLGRHVLVRQKNSFSKALNSEEIRQKIAEIEREIRENEARLQAMEVEPSVKPSNRPQVVKNDSFLSRLTPRSETQHSVEKVDVLRQLGLPLDEQHNVESYLSQFSLEGEFV